MVGGFLVNVAIGKKKARHIFINAAGFGIEEWVEQREEMNDGLDAFIALTQKYVDVEELTQTIVNEYIKKIVVYAPDKSSGKRKQKVKIFFNFVDDVDIPVISEPIVTQTTYERRKTA